MSAKTVRKLSTAQIEMMQLFPAVGVLSPLFHPKYQGKAYLRTFESLQRKGLISWSAESKGYVAHWGFISECLYEKIFPGETRRTYQRELERLNSMAQDFSEGSNANFMRQITVVKNLREMVIKAEQ